IQVIVSVLEELQSHFMPLMKTIHWNICHADLTEVNVKTNLHTTPDEDINISFLPLPETFNFLDCEDWQQLAQGIHNWLLTVPPASQQWTWGQDTFWFAYIAAYPRFPHGRWPFWDARIPLDSPFIQDWMAQKLELVAEKPEEVLHQIWLEFHSHIALFYLAAHCRNICRLPQ
ncbi:hypothetical protein M404DRAFT_135706, partial [Pisolithus tinctorius Marx 270]